MATAKRDLTDLRVQGPHVIDLRDDLVSIDEVARRLDVPKKTLYNWATRASGPAATVSASTCATGGAMCWTGSTG